MLTVMTIQASKNDSIQPLFENYNKFEHRIDLKLKYNNRNPDNRKAGFSALMAGGIAFISASILEGDGNYGTWQANPKPGNPYNFTYTTKPFWQQTRAIMLSVGIVFTISGVVGLANSK